MTSTSHPIVPVLFLALLAAAGSAADLPALRDDGLYQITSNGVQRQYKIAFDEAYGAVREGAYNGTFHKFPTVTSAASLIAKMQTLKTTSPAGTEIRMVAYPVGGDKTEFTRRIVGKSLLADLRPGASADLISQSLGALSISYPVPTDVSLVKMEFADCVQAVAAADVLKSNTQVESVSLTTGRKMSVKYVPNDPLYRGITGQPGYCWHLKNLGPIPIDVNVEPAWDFTIAGTRVSGSGIRIAIVDDGVEIRHNDIKGNDGGNHLDLNDTVLDTDPTPPIAAHGTAVAGLAIAHHLLNPTPNIGIPGVAWGSKFSAVRLLDTANQTDQMEADAFSLGSVHISNNSWGLPDGQSIAEAPGPLATQALALRSQSVIYTVAAGNGWPNDHANIDGYANNPYMLCVGAIGPFGAPVPNSEPGSNLVAAAPSEDVRVLPPRVITTDRSGGTLGYNVPANIYDFTFSRDWTNSFFGTSASTAMVSGVIALMKQRRPDLTYRDVKEIFLRTGNKLFGNFTENTGHLLHDYFVGGGLVDATAAYTTAATWTKLPTVVPREFTQILNIPIPDGGAVTRAIPVPYDISLRSRVETVQVEVAISHPNHAEIQTILQAPLGWDPIAGALTRDGTVSILDVGGAGAYPTPVWKYTTVRSWGEFMSGPWNFTAADVIPGGGTGTLKSVKLRFFTTLVPSAFMATTVVAPTILLNAPAGPPAIEAVGVEGRYFEYYIIASDMPTTFSATGLPAGLVLDPKTGGIRGSTVDGDYLINITATNEFGSDTRAILIHIDPIVPNPVITSGLGAVATVGQPFVYEITAGPPTIVNYGAANLPDGLNLVGNLITGTPTTQGFYACGLSATNHLGGTGNATMHITVMPAQFSLPEALEIPGLPVNVGGSNTWYFQNEVTHDGVDAATTGYVGEGATEFFETNIAGPTTLGFYWKVSSQLLADYLRFYIDGVEQAAISGEVDWQGKFFTIPAGGHTVRWSYEKNSGGFGGQDKGWVDTIMLLSPEQARQVGLDNTDLNFTNAGTGEWFIQGNVTHDGDDAMQSPALANSQSSTLSTTVTGPNVLRFFWKVNSQAGSDNLEVLVDGLVIETISGFVDWQSVDLPIPAGPHTVAWRYAKDAAGSGGDDAAWVDEVQVLPPGSSPSMFAFMQLSSFTPAQLLDPNISGPNADPDGDGRVNLLEYALGGNPTTSDTTGNPTITRVGDLVYFEFKIDTTKADLTYIAECSADLQNWQTVNASAISTSGDIVTVRATADATLAPSKFWRLRVEKL
jgi:subtilisin-like proprotein convertase family protein